MKARNNTFDEYAALRSLKHFLPAQGPHNDWVHHNPLRAFQQHKFHSALHNASEIFGYRTLLSPEEYRSFYNARKVNPEILEKVILERKGPLHTSEWRDKVLMKKFPVGKTARIGKLRAHWKTQYGINPDPVIHPTLFRILCSYLDQGISAWKFPVHENGFLASMREMEANSLASIFRTPRARNLLLYTAPSIGDLLEVVVGDEGLFNQYLFDQQFAHPGWSGMVSVIEDRPETLPHRRIISMHDLIIFELLMEIDALDAHFQDSWASLSTRIRDRPEELFATVPMDEMSEIQSIWQEALEWSYYDQVLIEIKTHRSDSAYPGNHPATTGPALLFEPHHEVDLATQALCVIGRHTSLGNLAPGRRAVHNSYDYEIDPLGDSLSNILNALVPVHAGINLEYFFSRVDSQKLGAGSRLLHHVMGFLGVANSMESDLRRGLSSQMVGHHDPVRMLFVVEHFPETVLSVIQKLPDAFEWFINEWVHLAIINPDTREVFVFKDNEMIPYKSYQPSLGNVDDLTRIAEYHVKNLPIYSFH